MIIQPEFPRYMRCVGSEDPGATINGLVALYAETTPDRAVEIGCWTGESAEIACQLCGRLVCVDPFEPPYFHMNEAIFDARLQRYKNILKIKKRSVDASTYFADETFDLVYIDALHDLESVKQDIKVWYPKVKRGGYIAGHDYDETHPEVIAAVYFMLNKPDKTYSDHSWMKRKP
jgi:predicted O-methyltransferase YrrM